MESIFNDLEVFVMSRPNTLSENQKQEIHKRLAQEILDNGWSDSDIDDIISDLSKLSKYDSGYKLAKRLESFHSKADYDIDTEFVEWLDSFCYAFDNAINANVKQWVKAHSIKPNHPKGSKLVVVKQFSCSPELACGNTIYINGYDESRGKYLVNTIEGSKSNLVVDYELIESNCNVSRK